MTEQQNYQLQLNKKNVEQNHNKTLKWRHVICIEKGKSKINLKTVKI